MFGLSWGQIAIIVLVGVFVLGPERIPTAVTWVLTMLRKARTMAAGAQAELRREIGPEIDELRRQVADLQSLKEIQDLRDLRDLHPKRLIGKNILGDEFSGGITGFLGLNEQPSGTGAGNGAAAGDAQANGSAPSGPASSVDAAQTSTPTSMGSAAKDGDSGTTADVMAAGAGSTPAPPHLPPSMTKLAEPTVAGSPPARTPVWGLAAGEHPPFDPDGT